MPDFGIFRGFNEKLFGDKLFAGQLPINLGNNFDPDAAAFFQRVSDAGGTLSETEQLAILTLVADLKNSGIWTAMKAIYPMVGASAAACAQNLKSSSFTGSFSTGWTFASTGVKPNGINASMNTNYNPSVNSTLNSGHISIYLRTNSLGSPHCDIGVFAGGNTGINIYSRFNNTQLGRIHEDDNNSIATTDSRGFNFATRLSSTIKKIGKNSTLTAFTVNSVALPNANVFLGALNGVLQYSDRENAFASIGEGLTDTEASNFYTAVQAFQTTLSRNV
jgi:hypothetical protein